MKLRMKESAASQKGAAGDDGRNAKVEGVKEAPAEIARRLPPAEAPAARPPVAGAQAPEAATQAILAELASLRRMVEKLSAPPTSADASLESSVDSIRRLLIELLESRMEPVIAEVAAIRSLAASAPEGEIGSVVDRLDLLLNDLGAIRFEAQRLDYFDPLIHEVLAERRDGNVPDRVILETVVPGYRTCRGRIVAKAGVAINRRA